MTDAGVAAEVAIVRLRTNASARLCEFIPAAEAAMEELANTLSQIKTAHTVVLGISARDAHPIAPGNSAATTGAGAVVERVERA